MLWYAPSLLVFGSFQACVGLGSVDCKWLTLLKTSDMNERPETVLDVLMPFIRKLRPEGLLIMTLKLVCPQPFLRISLIRKQLRRKPEYHERRAEQFESYFKQVCGNLMYAVQIKWLVANKQERTLIARKRPAILPENAVIKQ